MPSANDTINALIERFKQLIFKKKATGATAPASAPQSVATNRIGAPEAAQVPSSSYSRLQSMSSRSSANLPIYKQSTADEGYQASRSGAEATRRKHKASSTLTKLQALSASGTGAASPKPAAETEEQALNSLLDRLDPEK